MPGGTRQGCGGGSHAGRRNSCGTSRTPVAGRRRSQGECALRVEHPEQCRVGRRSADLCRPHRTADGYAGAASRGHLACDRGGAASAGSPPRPWWWRRPRSAQPWRGFRPASIKAYRDGLRLFLTFVAADRACRLTQLTPEDLTVERVPRFLLHLEEKRHNQRRTRNHRLTILQTPSPPLQLARWRHGRIPHGAAPEEWARLLAGAGGVSLPTNAERDARPAAHPQ